MSYTVTTNSDSGPGSLREAIIYANANPGTTITFGISNQTITLDERAAANPRRQHNHRRR